MIIIYKAANDISDTFHEFIDKAEVFVVVMMLITLFFNI